MFSMNWIFDFFWSYCLYSFASLDSSRVADYYASLFWYVVCKYIVVLVWATFTSAYIQYISEVTVSHFTIVLAIFSTTPRRDRVIIPGEDNDATAEHRGFVFEPTRYLFCLFYRHCPSHTIIFIARVKRVCIRLVFLRNRPEFFERQI